MKTITNNTVIKQEQPKSQILLINTFSSIKNHLAKIKYRCNGNFERIPSYTIDLVGQVYNHFNPKYYSKILGFDFLDKRIISIALENIGWLDRNILEDKYYDWMGNIYKEEDDSVIEINWRGHYFWSPYSEKQLTTLASLIVELCKEHDIPLKFIGENVKVNSINNFAGVVSRSNFFDEVTDISPAFNIDFFVKKLVEYEQSV